MDKDKFISTVQRFVAIEAVGVSALRGQGKGVLGVIRTYLGQLDLSLGDIKNKDQFIDWLDIQTEKILDQLPLKNRPWGAARKAINLFLRCCLYNKYLCEQYELYNYENWMEIPLDSAVAKGLRKEVEKKKLNKELPSWPGLKYLEKDTSDKYQEIAELIAIQNHLTAKVHLDIFLWLENR
jgi:hypothetical protein